MLNSEVAEEYFKETLIPKYGYFKFESATKASFLDLVIYVITWLNSSSWVSNDWDIYT